MVAQFLTPDLRIWDPFYASWKPISGAESVEVEATTDMDVDTMTIVLPAPHPLDKLLYGARVVGLPVTLVLNGVEWTGRVNTAKMSRTNSGAQQWTITVLSDHKHFHRLVSKSPETAVDGGAATFKGTLSESADWLIQHAVARTGLPTYFLPDVSGPSVEVVARTEDTVADVLGKAGARAGVFFGVQAITPDTVARGLPGREVIRQYMGAVERAWYQEFRGSGKLAYLAPHDRVEASPMLAGETAQPPTRFYGTAALDPAGKKIEPTAGVCWNVFEVAPDVGAGDVFYRDGSERVLEGVTRVGTVEELKRAGEANPWFGAHVTHWPEGAWKTATDTVLAVKAAETGLLVRGDGEQVKTKADVEALADYMGAGGAHAWLQAGQWVIANDRDFRAESEARNVPKAQPVWPGVMLRIHGERDRRQIVFSTAPGGGLESWEAEITAPDGAAIIAGTQFDAWMTGFMNRDGVQAGASAGEITAGGSPLSRVAKTAVEKSGGAIKGVNANISPSSTVDGTEVSFDSLSAVVDMSVTGPVFYRERFHSMGGEVTADTTAAFEEQFAQMQGSTAMTAKLGLNNSTIFGDDQTRPDGSVLPGWKPGDRVTLWDGDTQVSEVISGWRASWSKDKPTPEVMPLLGQKVDRQTPVDSLMDTIRRIEKLTERTNLAPPRLPKRSDVATVVAEEVEAPISRAVVSEAEARRREIMQSQREVSAQLEAARRDLDASGREMSQAVDRVRETAEAAKQWTVDNQQSFNLATSLAFAAQQQTNDFNAIQWVRQAEWNKTQEEINRAQAEINAAQEQVNRQQSTINDQNRRITSVQSEALSQIQAQQRTLTGATETLQRRVPAVLAVNGDYGSNEYLSYSKSGNDLMVTAKPGWSGVFVASIRVSALSSFSVHLSGQVGPSRSFSYGVGAFEKFSSGFILILPS
ncbi:hypothetical protein HW450_06800 [Corynebacterium hindlerae]|uniref:Gp28/Gp37-like domain-containing protein n=1 Tax=Corynebacterium hindlerae TaxID=699041 RepID=A0A7G5FBV7_9CORY|nr:hypothetical protein [Corynebacterium hindlerae]QMV84098.1 hypothetical protein HW450_06800 [Corynebacterium hindlerae]